MKQLDLPFKIDEQFENWEFDLDFMPQRVRGYFSFKYIGKNKIEYFGLTVKKAELIFNADFLTAVILIININENSQIKIYQNTTQIIPLKFLYYVSKNECLIIYGKSKFIDKNIEKLVSKKPLNH